jgi:hypothetical protein
MCSLRHACTQGYAVQYRFAWILAGAVGKHDCSVLPVSLAPLCVCACVNTYSTNSRKAKPLQGDAKRSLQLDMVCCFMIVVSIVVRCFLMNDSHSATSCVLYVCLNASGVCEATAV